MPPKDAEFDLLLEQTGLKTFEKILGPEVIQPATAPFAFGGPLPTDSPGGIINTPAEKIKFLELNQVPVSLEEIGEWMKYVGKGKTPKGGAKVTGKKLHSFFEHTPQIFSEANTKSEINDLCRIETLSEHGSPSWGTGIRLSEKYVLTCYHVIAGAQEISIIIPGYSGKEILNGHSCHISSSIRYQFGDVLAESPSRGDALELGDWNALDSSTDNSLDYALISLDLDSAEVDFQFTGPKSTIGLVTILNYQEPQRFSNQKTTFARPYTDFTAGEMVDKNLELVTLDSRYTLNPVAAGIGLKGSNSANRFRYGPNVQSNEGFSGSPIAMASGDTSVLVGMHHAKANDGNGQGIPIASILKDIKSRVPSSIFKAIAEENWYQWDT